MRNKYIVSILVAAALSCTGLVLAQDGPAPQTEERGHRGMGGPPPVMGTITSVGVDRFDIKRPDGSSETVMVNDQTHYRQRIQGEEPKELALEDLKVGDHVFVRGTPDGDKQVTAMGVSRVTAEQFERFQNGGFGGPGEVGHGPGGGTWGGGMQGNRAGGEIQSIKGNRIKVMSRRNGKRVIVVNAQTTFTKEGQSISFKDLKEGDRIFAVGKDVDGKFVATEVHSGRPGGGRGDRQAQPQN